MISPPAWAFESFDTLPSTSDHLIERVGRGLGVPTAVLALRQTRGRGSRGRRWSDACRALSLSAACHVPPAATAWLGYLGSVAFVDAIRETAGDLPGLTLKWPNDVLLAGRKLAGLLVECIPTTDPGLSWAVFGFGANLGPPSLETAIGLSQAGPSVEAPVLAAAVLRHLSALLSRLDGSPAAWLAPAWTDRAHPVGTTIRVSSVTGEQIGRFAGLAADGGLRLALDGGEKTVYSGLVTLVTNP